MTENLLLAYIHYYAALFISGFELISGAKGIHKNRERNNTLAIFLFVTDDIRFFTLILMPSAGRTQYNPI